jgi:hypothetical protein
MTTDVLIVSRTVMKSRRCIGGICLKTAKSLRLMDSNGSNLPAETPFEIGQVWEISGSPRGDLTPPHLEDYQLGGYQRRERTMDVRETVLRNRTVFEKQGRFWEGLMADTFGGALHFTARGSGYLGQPANLRVSTGFWLTGVSLTRDDSFDKVRFKESEAVFAEGGFVYPHVTYVGEAAAPVSIPAGTLCRISLARWWHPDDAPHEPSRCYLQLSGVY